MTKLFNPQVESLKNRNAPVVGENGGNLWGIEPLSIYSEKAQKTIRTLNKTGTIIQPFTLEANFPPGF